MTESHSFTLEEIAALDSKEVKIEHLFSIQGKNVVVSGASRGIGLMIAHTLISNGANVFAISRDNKTLESVSEALTKKGPGKCYAIPSNLSSENDSLKVAEAIRTINGEKGIHALINNAGANWVSYQISFNPFFSY
jgi:short-subunit dehydrogenase